MSCAKGCCGTPREHYQSVGTLTQGRSDWHKTKTHQTAENMKVDVTEHFDGRVDVNVKPQAPLKMRPAIHAPGE